MRHLATVTDRTEIHTRVGSPPLSGIETVEPIEEADAAALPEPLPVDLTVQVTPNEASHRGEEPLRQTQLAP